MKTCSVCGERKSLSYFSPRKWKTGDGHQSYCRKCDVQRVREKRKQEPAKPRVNLEVTALNGRGAVYVLRAGSVEAVTVTEVSVQKCVSRASSGPITRSYHVAIKHQGDAQPITLGSFDNKRDAEIYCAEIKEWLSRG